LCEQRNICPKCSKLVSFLALILMPFYIPPHFKVFIRGHKNCVSTLPKGNRPFPCSNCGTFRSKEKHYCYIQPIGPKSAEEKSARNRYLFMDIETTQNEKIVVNGIKVSEIIALYF
jgi:hypothetical protein